MLDDEEVREIQALTFTDNTALLSAVEKLQLQTRNRIRSVEVVMSNRKKGSPSVQQFGDQVAARLASRIQKTRITGVAWGKTIASVATALCSHVTNRSKESPPVVFFPVCGEPVDFPASGSSASTSTNVFDQAVNRSNGRPLSLGAVAARIPKFLGGSEQGIVRTFIERSQHYQRIFVGTKALICTADCILTSGGTFLSRTSDDLWLADILDAERITHEELSALTIGDLGGALIPRLGLSQAKQARLKEITSRWTGMTLEHLCDCSARNVAPAYAGVILIAMGTNKAQVVAEALRVGCVTQLIVDQSLARELIHIATTYRPYGV